MARIVFVTVGTSAITNQDLWDGNVTLPPELSQEGDWGKSINDGEAACIKQHIRNGHVNWAKVERQVRGEFASFEAALTRFQLRFKERNGHERRENPKLTSAEVMSTWLAAETNRLDGGPLEAGEDKVVLIASRTCIGQMAGRINESLFKECLFVGGGMPEVSIERVDDLRLEGIHEDAGGTASLSDQVREIHQRHSRGDRRTPLFNITGGYKGLIPAITVICAEARNTMLYLHESMKRTVRLHFDNGQVREEVFEDMNV